MDRLYNILDATIRRLTNNTMSGSRVTLDSYTSSQYTFPSDGYVALALGAAGNANASVSIYDSSGAYMGEIGGLSNNAYTSQMTFVRKGMKARVSSISNSGHVYFAPWGGVLHNLNPLRHFFTCEEVVV